MADNEKTEKEKAETTIRIYQSSKKQLKDLKFGNEGDAVVLARILAEREELRKDKETLYKIILKTSDSVAFPNNIHRATFFITKVVYDGGADDEEKIETLKTYLAEMLNSDSSSITASIENIKDMLNSIGEPVPQTLLKFESYVNESSN